MLSGSSSTFSTQMPRGALAVVLADDELLRDVDETTREVAGVGGAERGVGETLAGTVGGDEVLEDREALTEVRLDRPRDDLTTRVGHQATHTGDLLHLHDVASGARAHHHVDGVELLRRISACIASRTWSVASVQISISFWRRSSSVMMPRSYCSRPCRPRPRSCSRSAGLARRRPHVGDRDREPGTGRVLEAEVLQLVEALGHDRTSGSAPRASLAISVRSRFLHRRGRGTGSRAGTPR